MSHKPPLLMLHGLGMSASAWDDVTPVLADRFTLIVPTAAGHRGGPPLNCRATVDALTDVTEDLLDKARLHRVHVVGNSLGGWMAIELGRRGRARSVCAFSPAGLWNSDVELDSCRKTLRRNRKIAGLARLLAPPLMRFAPARRLALVDIATRANRLFHRQAAGVIADLMRCNVFHDLLTTSEYLTPFDPLPCPITVAWSALDRIFPATEFTAAARQRLPKARILELPDVGHVPMIDDPHLFAQIIIDATSESGETVSQ